VLTRKVNPSFGCLDYRRARSHLPRLKPSVTTLRIRIVIDLLKQRSKFSRMPGNTCSICRSTESFHSSTLHEVFSLLAANVGFKDVPHAWLHESYSA
jgi:hypothetical protein